MQKDSINNKNYRKVIYTGNMQLVFMSLKPGQEIGMETHRDHDQFIRVEKGLAMAIINGEESKLHKNGYVIIPAGTKHNIINWSQLKDLKLSTIYSPPEHAKKTIQRYKIK